MKKTILAIAVCLTALTLSACSNSDDAFRALDNAGYTNIAPGGYDWLACGQDDFYHTKFTATNANGKNVKGVVCSGLLFKSATIRF